MERSLSGNSSVVEADEAEDHRPLLPPRMAPPARACSPQCGLHRALVQTAGVPSSGWPDGSQPPAAAPIYNGHLYISPSPRPTRKDKARGKERRCEKRPSRPKPGQKEPNKPRGPKNAGSHRLQERVTSFTDVPVSPRASPLPGPLRSRLEAGGGRHALDDVSLEMRRRQSVPEIVVTSRDEGLPPGGAARGPSPGPSPQHSPKRQQDARNDPYWRSHNIGWRLLRRRALFLRRQRLNDGALAVGMFGVVMMVMETELSWSVYSKLYVHDIGAEDWRIAMTTNRLALIALELAVAVVHPYPVGLLAYVQRRPAGASLSETELEIVLALPMFLRLYLLGRAAMLHSRLFTDTASRSIGALNKIHFNSRFVGKTVMTTYPGTVLMAFSVSLWIVAAWGLHVCERHHNYRDLSSNYMEALWMVSVTFLSIGYGDVVPHTYCGRSICLLTGIMVRLGGEWDRLQKPSPPARITGRTPVCQGAGCTVLVVAVVARKLELTRAEKHVHNFMMDSHISKTLKIAAANVLRETWLIYKYTKLSRERDPTRVRMHQRKLLLAIDQLRRVKMEKRILADQGSTLVDLCKVSEASGGGGLTALPMQSLVYDVLSEVQGCRGELDTHIHGLEKHVEELRKGFKSLMPLLSSTLSTQNSSIRHLLREREVKNECFSGTAAD
ncbi:unnamed protein product [Menidia menidia]|uniref:(Atlantic silverside) hypothetical protein n=1 Tax=Menidia menidia TaxID=238744 RepID=A0A8S4ATB7_9TELE|nr:unnamed protein product [Menidia menidia]